MKKPLPSYMKSKFGPGSARGLMAEHAKKVRAHRYRYIDPDAMNHVVGKWAPLSAANFAFLLDNYLSVLNDTGRSIMDAKGTYNVDIPGANPQFIGVVDKLLNANKKYRPGSWAFFNDLDFDIVHHCVEGEKVQTFAQPYFATPEYGRSKEETRVVVHAKVAKFEGTQWAISFPLQYVMKGYPRIKQQHFGYAHKIALLNDDGSPDKEYYYIGVTGRNWLQRMNEHFNEIKSGSNKLFHQTWREFIGRKDVMLSSELIVGDHNYEQIMAWEETYVDFYMNQGTALNMIPGGFKGMKFLHEHRLLNSDRVSIKDRDKAIEAYHARHPRAGIPNLLISELWKDDEYAAKIICGGEDRLSVEQIYEIRRLNALGFPVEKITTQVGAKNQRQVERLLKGETYSRIH